MIMQHTCSTSIFHWRPCRLLCQPLTNIISQPIFTDSLANHMVSCLEHVIVVLQELLTPGHQDVILIETIEHCQQAVVSWSEEQSDIAMGEACLRLANELFDCYTLTGDHRILIEVITLQRQSLSRCPPSHPDYGSSCRFLGKSLWEKHNRTGDERLLTEAIHLQREFLSLCSPGHPDRALACEYLAISLGKSYENTGDDQALLESIGLARESLLLCPPSDKDRAIPCGNLANLLWMSYENTGHGYLLAEAIDLQRESLSLRPSGHPNRALICANMATLLHAQYENTGDDSLLIEAIDLERESLSLRPLGHPDRAISCGSLASSLGTYYKIVGDDNILMEAIGLERDAISLRPPGHPQRSHSCTNLGGLLSIRFDSTGDDYLLMEAIHLQQEALSLSPIGHPDRALFCENLASSLGKRYESTGDKDALLKSTDLLRESLSLHSLGHPHRGLSCLNLATSLQLQYERNGGDHLLVEAINLQRESLDLHPQGHPNRALSCGNLAGSLQTRYESVGDQDILFEAIDLQREALSLRPHGHPDRGYSCGNLGNLLQAFHKLSGNERLLIEAIELQREAHTLFPPGHPRRAFSCGNLASLLWTRYNGTNDERLLSEAIELEREALSLRPPGHPYRSFSSGNLGHSIHTRHSYEINLGNADSLLLEVIELARESLSLCSSGDPDRATHCGNLARALWHRYNSTGDNQVLLEVTNLDTESLSLRPPGHPNRMASCHDLARTLWKRFEISGDKDLLDVIHNLLQESLPLWPPHARWRDTFELAKLHLQIGTPFYDAQRALQYLVEGLEHHPDSISQTLLCIAPVLQMIWDHVKNGQFRHHAAFMPVYHRLVRLLPYVTNPALETKSQLRELRWGSYIGYDAFVNAAIAENWQLGLEDLEMVQGLLWSQRLHYREPQFKDVPPSLSAQLEELLRAMVTATPTVDSQGLDNTRALLTEYDLQHNHVVELYAVLKEIRRIPGLERFMLGEKAATLISVASTHPVVVLVNGREHAYALLLTSDAPSCTLIPLDWNSVGLNCIFTDRHPSNPNRGPAQREELSEMDLYRGLKKSKTTAQSPISRQLRYLWIKVVQPVLQQLSLKPADGRSRPRLYWYPTGMFSALPLHAAGVYDGPTNLRVSCANYVVSSYIPSLTALLRAQGTQLTVPRSTCSFTLVAEKRAKESYLPTIHQVEVEVDNIEKVATSHGIQEVHSLRGSTTVSDTCAAMQTADIVHLACHGIQASGDALQSGFCLGDGRLTISKLMELKLDRAFLAFLSACETAKGDWVQPDQVIHLAAAMIFTGFKTVVATMWPISDDDGPQMAKWFYEEILGAEVIDTDTIAYALDTAVKKLREESGASLYRWAPFILMGA